MPTDIAGALTEEIGPLPVWAWGVAIAGGLGVGWLIQREMSTGGGGGAESATEPSEPGDDLPATEGPVGLPGGGADAGMAPLLPEEQTGGGGDPDDVSIGSNQQWRAAAVDWLAGEGVPPTTSDSALGRYLGGQELTEAAARIVDRAIREFGSPPEGAPSPIVADPADPDDDPAESPEPEPEPEPEEPAPPQDSRILVRDNQGVLFVIDPYTKVRQRVPGSSRGEARERYGSELTRKVQLPPFLRSDQDRCWERNGRDPIDEISLWGACGWEEGDRWQPGT